ncbi:SED4 [Candida margitis]|uniref:SED4 n=1 Tax=Candida margitis TaxID=1775924 RepID=UPI0022269A7E|nr:SED4 [Candida margitis]KAI5968610.1 SED4 [Candida margitis]
MGLKESASIDVGYPILGAKFINNKTVLVAGGGGEGSNGIPNKITAIKCSFKVNDAKRRLQKFREVSLPSNEDSPQCIDVTRLVDENEYNVVVGCNQSSELIRSMNINNNVRKYKYNKEEHLIFDDAAQFEEEISGDTDEYPKVIKISQDNTVGCLMTSALPSVLYFFNPDALELKFKYKPPTYDEIKDFALSPKTGTTLCYITSSSVVSISTQTNSVLGTSKTTPIDKQLQKYNLSKIKFINNHEVVISASVKGGKGAALLRYDLTKQKITHEQVITKKLNNIVALDVSVPQDLVAFAGNDLIVYIVKLSNFKLLQTIKNLHPFAITSVCFSPNGTKLATGSAANILNVVRVPPKYASGRSVIGTVFQYLFTIILIAALGIGIQKAHENGQLDVVLELSKQYSKDYREIGLRYGKIGTELAGEYGKVGLELAEKYGKRAYDVAEEYGNKYGSKLVGLYKEKFDKEDVVASVGEQAKNTLNDIVSEVTRDLHAETIETDFNSETLDQIKLSTGAAKPSDTVDSSGSLSVDFTDSTSLSETESSVSSIESEATTKVASISTKSATATATATVAVPEFESILEVVNNATTVNEPEHVEANLEVQDSPQDESHAGATADVDANDANTEQEEYVDIIEEVAYEESVPEDQAEATEGLEEEATANYPNDSRHDDGYEEVVEEVVEEVEPTTNPPTDEVVYEEVVEEVVEEVEPTLEETDVEVADLTTEENEYTEIIEEAYEEVYVDSDTSSDAQEENTLESSHYPSHLDNDNSEEIIEKEKNESVPEDVDTVVHSDKMSVAEEIQEPVQESEPITGEAQEEIPSDESEKIVYESNEVNYAENDEEVFTISSETKPVADEETTGYNSESPIEAEYPSDNDEAVQEAPSHVAEYHEDENTRSEEIHVSDVVESKETEEKEAGADAISSKLAEEQVAQNGAPTKPIEEQQVVVDDGHTLPVDSTSEASDVKEEEIFSAQSVEAASASDKEEIEYTPEEPVSLQESHTVEVSGTGGVDPTPKPSEVESVEEPSVSISTPLSDTTHVEQETSSLSPADEEASTVEPTSKIAEAIESLVQSRTYSAPSKSAKKVTRVVTRTVRKPKSTAPTRNAREKDEL